MELRHFIKLATLTLGLALFTLFINGSTEAKTAQNDFSCTAISEIPQIECQQITKSLNPEQL